MKRKRVSKKTRFEVFKRDSFTCQYCGAKAPDVILELDHINPVSNGGSSDILNLVTSCYDCNRGKSNRLLSDDAVVVAKLSQLHELQERRNQIEMMIEWEQGLLDIEDEQAEIVARAWNRLISPFTVSDTGMGVIKRHLRKYSVEEIIVGVNEAVDHYIEYDEDSNSTHSSVEKAFDMIWRICNAKRRDKNKPWMKDVYYLRKILMNKFGDRASKSTFGVLEEAVGECEIEFDVLKRICIEARSLEHFFVSIKIMIADAGGANVPWWYPAMEVALEKMDYFRIDKAEKLIDGSLFLNLDELMEITTNANNWTEWRRGIETRVEF